MTNKRGKSVDNTYLSIDQATERGFPHADYIAHCLRWSHVVKFIRDSRRYETARVFDIGCGKELPLAKTLYSSRLIVRQFVGVDYNKGSTIDMSPFHTGKFPCDAFGNVDFASNQVWFDQAEDDQWLVNVRGTNQRDQVVDDYWVAPNIYVCFEVVEHVEPAHVRALLTKVREGLRHAKDNGSSFEPTFFMSTPNWDVVHCADNHVNEMKHDALGWLVEDCGLRVAGHYGTFASQKDYRNQMFADYPGIKAVWDKLHGYYESNYLSTIFAPLYPAEARNCLWKITLPPTHPASADPHVKFPDHLLEGLEPWTSSEHWADLKSGGSYDPTNTPVGRIER